MEKKDYYDILGVRPDADARLLKEDYRKLAFRWHPDRNPANSEAIARMKDLNEAYAVLSDQAKKQEYDSLRNSFGSSAYSRFRQNRSDDDIFKGSDVNQVFEEICRNFGFRGAEEVFKEFYGPGARRFSFVNAAPGKTSFFFRFGAGNLFRHISPQRGKDISDTMAISPWLALRGGRIKYFPRGTARELIVSIPPGIRAGQKIRLKGMGAPGRAGGGPGDLFICVRIRKRLTDIFRDWLKSFRKR